MCMPRLAAGDMLEFLKGDEENFKVTRITLDDSAQHGNKFAQVIIPRLHEVARAVHVLQKDNNVRYRLLIAMAGGDMAGVASLLSEELALDFSKDLDFGGEQGGARNGKEEEKKGARRRKEEHELLVDDSMQVLQHVKKPRKGNATEKRLN